MVEKTYLKKDLTDYADLETSTFGHNRGDALTEVLPEAADIFFTTTGNYQGDYAIVVLLDGYVWVDVGGYGSCAGCDGFLNHAEEETERILRDAYCFDNADDLESWRKSKNDDTYYREARNEVLVKALYEAFVQKT